ncbi:MAG: molybdenum cofactor biosynthesis protein MoaE [Candidimonas sp.]|jgi:molybdopterin synthase catalytic subunit
MVVVQHDDFDAAELTAQLRRRTQGKAGAIVTFTGYVRDYAEDTATDSLFLEHYPGMCERRIGELCEQARQRWPIADCLVAHRVGELRNTEQIVFVAVAGAHRGDAFRACEYLIDALKTSAPFWKRETLADGRQFWVRQQDRDARKAEQWHTATGNPDHHE